MNDKEADFLKIIQTTIDFLKSTQTIISEIKKELKTALAKITLVEQVIARIIEKEEEENEGQE